ncbi:PP2C family protein-serine/threonine phosphatase [Telmatobacter sp. DSM 110680]|uniref:PP2C family protein-serine/threonine phosphatase n=1 Tax=Telmatobacter sp. DSM 110680 TaxID=3036704 RepID=A0AAU7DDC8_9BACT
MRRALLVTIALLMVASVQSLALQAHPRPPFHGFGRPPQAAPPPQAGQEPAIIDASSLGSPLILNKGWRVGISSDAKAANPEFDDSGWAIRDGKGTIADVAEPGEDSDRPDHEDKYAWFRLHLKLAPNHGPVALLIELPVSQSTPLNNSSSGPGADVYANGKLILPEGPHPDETFNYQQISRLYKLNISTSETSLTLAIRTLYVPFGLKGYTNFFYNRTLRLGNPEDLDRELQLWSVKTLFERLPRLVIAILLLFLSVFLVTLYFTQRGHPEYLWLALHELVQVPIGIIDQAGSSARLDNLLYGALYLQLVFVSAYLYFEFLVSFLGLKRRWYIKGLRYTAPILLLIAPAILMVGHNKAIGIMLAIVLVCAIFWVIAWAIFVFLTLIIATIKRNFEAGLLLIPLVLTLVGIIEPFLTGGMGDFGGVTYKSPLTIQAGPIPIHFAAIADFTGLLAIIVIIFVRFLRIHHEQERASGELAAARSVQELMIPREKVETPGYEVDSVYNPANEVGGDFFHVEPTADGGLLIILGDVAGKGLQAAMNVSMLMGALRRTSERSPARILESLNRVLIGSDSFTTCQVAWFGSDGEVVVANAGHLPPYLNTQEVRLPGGLPLGVVADVTYDEVRLYLHPGDRLLMMSDGVVEARQSSGELFGFDRVHNLSNQSAFYIADAAKAFGQEDDITVLTIRRLAKAMAA